MLVGFTALGSVQFVEDDAGFSLVARASGVCNSRIFGHSDQKIDRTRPLEVYNESHIPDISFAFIRRIPSRISRSSRRNC
jgi:hypothetical protein